MFQEQAPSCMYIGWGTYPGACFGACLRSNLLRVYWLEYLPGSVFRERVSGASSLVCTGLYVRTKTRKKASCPFSTPKKPKRRKSGGGSVSNKIFGSVKP